MQQFILRENVLTDDTLFLPDEGKIFRGGYIGFIHEYTYRNAWSDDENIRRFRSKKQLTKHIKSRYPDFDLMDCLF